MDASERGELKAAFCLGGNLFGSNPDSRYAHRALGKLELVKYLNTTLNNGHAWGTGRETLILPVLARDEEPQPTTQESMFNYVRLSDGGPKRQVHVKSEIEIITAIAEQVLGNECGVDWREMRNYQHIRQFIARAIPGFSAIAEIDKNHEEFQIANRTLHDAKFPTASGKAQFTVHPLPKLAGEANELRLMTVRSEGQFNTVVYEEEDIYRGQDRRDVILLNRKDIDRLGLEIDEMVEVRSRAGTLRGILVRAFDIREGNALMYYPEANVLVPRDLDPSSKTPAFKCIPIQIEKLSSPSLQNLELLPGRQKIEQLTS